jgi:hypothetical protein
MSKELNSKWPDSSCMFQTLSFGWLLTGRQRTMCYSALPRPSHR